MESNEIYDEELGEISVVTFERYYRDTQSADLKARTQANEWIRKLYVSPHWK